MKKNVLRIVILLLFISVALILLVGCSDKGLKGDKPPMPIVSVGEERIEVVRASYCWNVGCVDTVGPPGILDGKVPTPLQKGEKIKIQFDYEPQPSIISVSRMLDTEQKWVKDDLSIDTLTVPKREGIYFYDFIASWQSEDGKSSLGDSYYAFVIEVK